MKRSVALLFAALCGCSGRELVFPSQAELDRAGVDGAALLERDIFREFGVTLLPLDLQVVPNDRGESATRKAAEPSKVKSFGDAKLIETRDDGGPHVTFEEDSSSSAACERVDHEYRLGKRQDGTYVLVRVQLEVEVIGVTYGKPYGQGCEARCPGGGTEPGRPLPRKRMAMLPVKHLEELDGPIHVKRTIPLLDRADLRGAAPSCPSDQLP